MAKPKSATDLASSATSSSRSHTSKRTSCRQRSSSSPRSSSAAPTSALLASLATVAASCSSADGRPLSPDSQPPDFLCPFLPLDAPEVYSKRDDPTDDENADAYLLTPTPTRTKRTLKRRGVIADKYVQGPDGRWRKEQTWTLYGSTYCECASGSTSPQTGVPEVDDQADPTSLASTSVPTAQSSTTDMTDSLPSGWSETHSTTRDPFAPIILVLALLLAMAICGLIGGLVWMRKRRALQHKDLEKKTKVDPIDDVDTEPEDMKRFRSNHQKWAKATARWKANVRVSARRRRKRPQSVVSNQDIPHNASTASLTSQYSYTAESGAHSKSSDSYFTDNCTILTSRTETNDTDRETLRVQNADNESEVTPDTSRPTLPPDYPVDGTLLGVPNGHLGLSFERLGGSEAGASVPEDTLTRPHSALSSHDHLPYIAPTNSAHIATDDKTLLAHMANLASHPPVEGSARGSSFHGESASIAGPSVPILDEFEELPISIRVIDEDGPSGSQLDWHPTMSASSSCSIQIPVPTYSREPSPHPPIFPAPPTKAQLAASLFYDYPSTFEEDIADAELAAPSAPPFEFGAPEPSAPPLDGGSIDMGACAPPLIDEDEEIQLGFIPGPSAPPPPALTFTGGPSGPVSPSEAEPSSSTSSHSRRPSAPFSLRAANPPDYLP